MAVAVCEEWPENVRSAQETCKCLCKWRPLWAQTVTDGIAYELLRRLFHIGNFCFWVPFFKQVLLKNCALDFVEICNVCTRKVIIKAAKRIFNSDKIFSQLLWFLFWRHFFGTHCKCLSKHIVAQLLASRPMTIYIAYLRCCLLTTSSTVEFINAFGKDFSSTRMATEASSMVFFNNLRLLESRHTAQPTQRHNQQAATQDTTSTSTGRPGITTTGFSTGKKLPHDGAKRLH